VDRLRRTDMSPIIGGIEVFGQEYDPDLAALDPAARAMADIRLRSGFGAPPVAPYAQKVGSGAILRRLLPGVFSQPVGARVLSKVRQLLPP
jgi:hypothetical protein